LLKSSDNENMEQRAGERIEKLRKNLKLKQTEFAEKIGLTNSAISAIELGKAPLTEANIRLICLTFGVNKEWLRHGAGEMFEDETLSTEQERRLLALFEQLSPTAQELLIASADGMVKQQEAKKQGAEGKNQTKPEKGENPV
jgi:transcriptional regulator with XRE-family HTH domain